MPDTPDTDLRGRLEEAVSNLPRREREMFIAFRVDDMSYAEIAARTGLSLCAVERNVASAIYKVAKQLDGRRLSCWERWF